MAGVTPNSNILDALDEVVKSLNDLTSRPISIQINGSGCGCGGGGGTAPPLPPGTDPIEGGTPPDGFEEYTNVNITSCKKAAFVYFGTLEALTKLQKYEDTIEYGFIKMVELIILVYGGLGGVAALIVGKVGGVIDLVTSFIDATVEIEQLIQVWEENQEELICAFYGASQAGSGASYSGTLGQILTILGNGGASTGNLGVIAAMLPLEVLTILWYNPAFRDVTIEQQIADYEIPEGVDCGVCAGDVNILVIYGTLDNDTVNGDGTRTMRLSSQDLGTVDAVRLDAEGHSLYQGGSISCFRVVSITEVTPSPSGYLQHRKFNCEGGYIETTDGSPTSVSFADFYYDECLEYLQIFSSGGDSFVLDIKVEIADCK
jgi:hypothetical protein